MWPTNKLLPLVALLGCHPDRSVAVVQAKPPPARTETQAGTARLEHGAYLVSVAGCLVCHTPLTVAASSDMSRLGAGGLENRLPGLGVWRAPNITPDRETGIGAWTDEQIVDAIRMGVRPDGKRLLPVMPYSFYHRMTDADARAIVVYLRALSPAPNKVAPSELAMQPLVLQPPGNNVDPTGDPRAHGEYLVALMHCAACHTPKDGQHAGEPFAGGTKLTLRDGRTVVAPNLTSDPATGLGNWTEDDLAMTIQTMIDPQGRTIQGPMAMYRDAWSRLTDADLHAVAKYIKSLPAVINDVNREDTHQVGVR